jgi:hypothetical protein
MNCEEELGRFAALQIVLAIVTEKDPFIGLPCFIFYSRVIQLIVRTFWCGCYGVAREFKLSEIECDFLYRWFLLGGILDNDEFQDALSAAIRFCSQAIILQTGWAALDECFKFATQHGRIEQLWGLNCLMWIRAYRLQ